MPAKVFSLNEILSIFSSSSVYNKLINEIQKGFINYSNKVVYVAPVIHLGSTDKNGDIPQMIGGGDVCLKSGYIVNDKYYVIKIAGGGFKNPKENYANFPNSGAMLVFSQLTGALNGILMDDGILTELRTAAASALASKYFAPKQITNIGIVGTGIQGRFQLDMLQYVIPFKTNSNIKIYVYGRNKDKRISYKQDMIKKGFDCIMTDNMYEIGLNCNLIITCTSARNPVLCNKHFIDQHGHRVYEKNKNGLHINCIGADSNGKQELDEIIVSKYADLILVDSKKQCVEIGEIQHSVKNETISMDKVIEFGVALNENNLNKFKRRNDNDSRVTIFDSTGVAVQDVVISKMVYQTLTDNAINSKL